MYALYRDHCSEQEVEPVSEWNYGHVFNTTFNLFWEVSLVYKKYWSDILCVTLCQ